MLGCSSWRWHPRPAFPPPPPAPPLQLPPPPGCQQCRTWSRRSPTKPRKRSPWLRRSSGRASGRWAAASRVLLRWQSRCAARCLGARGSRQGGGGLGLGPSAGHHYVHKAIKALRLLLQGTGSSNASPTANSTCGKGTLEQLDSWHAGSKSSSPPCPLFHACMHAACAAHTHRPSTCCPALPCPAFCAGVEPHVAAHHSQLRTCAAASAAAARCCCPQRLHLRVVSTAARPACMCMPCATARSACAHSPRSCCLLSFRLLAISIATGLALVWTHA